MKSKIKLAIGIALVGLSVGAGSAAAVAHTRAPAAPFCKGTVNSDTMKCETPACGLGDTCCACAPVQG